MWIESLTQLARACVIISWEIRFSLSLLVTSASQLIFRNVNLRGCHWWSFAVWCVFKKPLQSYAFFILLKSRLRGYFESWMKVSEPCCSKLRSFGRALMAKTGCEDDNYQPSSFATTTLSWQPRSSVQEIFEQNLVFLRSTSYMLDIFWFSLIKKSGNNPHIFLNESVNFLKS